jgi:hypothetical protein
VVAVPRVLASAAGAIVAVTIVLYQAWLMPFFQPFFAGREGLARLVFYALYGSLLLTAAMLFGTRADIRRTVLPLAAVSAVIVAATALHPIGMVTRDYIIAIGMGGAAVVLMQGSAPAAVLRLSAAVTVLNAALCFVDLLFADGFTTTMGRAAGLALNPNVAAAAVLLGAAASHRAVPRRFHLSFVVLTLGSIAATLSRSSMLTAAAAIMIPAAVESWRRARARRPLWTTLDGVRPAAVLAVALAAWVATAAIVNPRFRPVVHAVVSDSLDFADAIGAAHEFVAVAAQDASSLPAATASSPANAAGPAAGVRPAAGADASRIAALDTRLADEGARNSISARALFLERAMLEYRHSGFFGMGLEAAHPLVPHNTFVLFALAFGHPGWLIPLALVALALYSVRDARDLPLPVAMLGTMTTSHDILLTPSLFLPIAIGIGGMIAGGATGRERQDVHRSIAFGASAAVGLFVLGCLVIVSVVPSLTIERLSPASILKYGTAYLAPIPPQTYPGMLVPAVGDGPEDTMTFLRENTRPLQRVRWNLATRRPVAPGEYAVSNGDGLVLFALADGSDPRGRGHAIDLGLPHTVGVPFYALLASLAVWCASVLLWMGRTNHAAQPAGVQEALS